MTRKKVTIPELKAKAAQRTPITMVTAYDYPSALFADRAKFDMILVGDSLGMVVLGLDSTVPVTMDEMLHHCRAVARGAQAAHLVGDMPFLSYQASVTEAITNAGLFLKTGGMDSVKLEGGRRVAPTVEAIVNAGIPVMGHIGLTPQSVSMLGGYRVQGRDVETALALVDDATALEEAGCYALVLEAVPEPLARLISERLEIPTIGIGAGPHCDGQVLVYHDLLGIFDKFTPHFVKQYADLGGATERALSAFRDDVLAQRFPAGEHSYGMRDDILRAVEERLAQSSATGDRSSAPGK